MRLSETPGVAIQLVTQILTITGAKTLNDAIEMMDSVELTTEQLERIDTLALQLNIASDATRRRSIEPTRLRSAGPHAGDSESAGAEQMIRNAQHVQLRDCLIDLGQRLAELDRAARRERASVTERGIQRIS